MRLARPALPGTGWTAGSPRANDGGVGTAAGMVTTSPGSPVCGLPTGTVTLLFTDLEGSTRLVERFGARFGGLLADHFSLLRRAVAAHHGQEFGTEGDALFAVFARARDAVCAAAEAQHALAAHPWPEDARVRVRMGLHTGTPDPGPGCYVGHDVHRAARIAGLAHGGQVLMSATTRALAEPLPDGLGALDLGRHRLKDLSEPEHLHQLTGQGLAADFPPLRSQDVVPTNLPRERTSFVGRETELTELTDLLRRHRLLTLTGPGGTGKTRLAIRLARRVMPDFPGGVWLVRLTDIQDPRLVGTMVTTAMGLADRAERDPVTAVAEYTRGRRHLLVVDNVEHVIAGAQTLADLLDSAPGVSVLATSREVLHLHGEQVYAVAPLALPAPGTTVSAEQAAQTEAVRLFVERARAVRPDFAVSDADAPALVEIARRLEGLPLAIELAAARVGVLSPQELAARLERRLGVLTGGPRDLPERQRTLRAAIAWSHELLTDPERRLLEWLSVFTAPVDLATAEDVCAPGEQPVLDTMTALVDKSLLRRVPFPDGRTRFWMLESVKEYVREVADDLTRCRDDHARHYEGLGQAMAAGLFGPGQLGWLDRAEEEAADIASAVSWSLERGDTDRAARITVGVHGYWWLRAHFTTGRHWARQVLAAGPTDPLLRARVLLVAARLGAEQAVFASALDDLAAAEQTARQHQDTALLAQVLSERVAVEARRHGRLESALADEALAAYRGLGDRVGEGELLIRIGGVLTLMDRRDEAVRHFGRARALMHAAGNDWGEASALNNLGFVAAAEERFPQAEELLDQSLALFERLRTPEGLGSVHDSLAVVRMGQGRPAEAVPLLERSEEIARELGYRPGTAIALTQLAWCRAQVGDLSTGAGEALEALELVRELEVDLQLGALDAAAAVLARSGRSQAARQLLEAADRVRAEEDVPLTPLEARRLEADREVLAAPSALSGAEAPAALTGAADGPVQLTVPEALELAARELRRAHPAW